MYKRQVFSIMEDAQKSVKKNDNVNRRQNDAAFFKETRLERDIGSNICLLYTSLDGSRFFTCDISATIIEKNGGRKGVLLA